MAYCSWLNTNLPWFGISGPNTGVDIFLAKLDPQMLVSCSISTRIDHPFLCILILTHAIIYQTLIHLTSNYHGRKRSYSYHPCEHGELIYICIYINITRPLLHNAPNIYLSIYPSIHLSNLSNLSNLSIYLSISLSIYIYMYLPI